MYRRLFYLIIPILLFSYIPVFAERISSWKPFLELYEKRDCTTLTRRLKALSHPSSWLNPELWSRSRIINAKCQMHLSKHPEARKTLEHPPSGTIGVDAWIYQKIRLFLQVNEHEEAVVEIRKLLSRPERQFYLGHLRRHLKDEFHSEQEIRKLFPLLHETRKHPDWFLKDYTIHALYRRGAKLAKTKLERKYRVLGWQFPLDEKTARGSHKNLLAADAKKLSPLEIRNRIRTLDGLGLNRYLLKHLPQLRKGRSVAVRKELGEAYLKALFSEKRYAQILKLRRQEQLSKTWSLPEEIQLYWMARSFMRRKSIADGRKIIRLLEKRRPQSAHLPILYDTIATHYKWSSQIEKSQYWWSRLLRQFPQHYLAAPSAWKLAWSYSQTREIGKALAYLSQGLRTGIVNSEVRAKFLYWQGKWQSAIGRVDLSEKSFLQLIRRHPNTYYGTRLLSSREIPQAVLSVVQSRRSKLKIEPALPKSKQAQKLLRRTEFLFDIAEPEQALRELFVGLGRYQDESLNWYMSRMLHRQGRYYALQRMIANYYLPDLITLEVGDHPLWELAYPRPYWEQLQNYARQAEIDPYFVLAIMREESHFNPRALSSSKAIGLMQLMPATAKEVAKKQKIKIKNRNDIFDPYINARLGTFYLGWLAGRFNSELIYTAGGYNAGPTNMNKWIKRWNGKSLDSFVEHIPFEETQNYVKRVYRSYKLYKLIYSS